MRLVDQALTSVFLAVAACYSPPDALIICHNSNCVEPVDVAEDDTLVSLAASLAAEDNGRPIVDGVELDVFWRGDSGECLFAHDLDDLSIVSAATAAAGIVADHLQRPGPVSWTGDEFKVFMELKGHVGPSKSDRHTDEQLRQHASCALEVFSQIDAAANAGGREVEVVFTSFEPKLLQAVVTNAAWPVAPTARPRLGIIRGVPAPLDSQTERLSSIPEDVAIDLVETHPDWLLDAEREAFDSLGWDVAFWMFSATSEILDAIERYEPAMVVTGEARTVRRWMSR